MKLPELPLDAMLSASARRATPRLGRGTLRSDIPTKLSNAFTGKLEFEPLEIEDLTDPTVAMERVL